MIAFNEWNGEREKEKGKEQTYDRNELLRALSMALDLAERQPLNHATRTAYAALRLARVLELPETEVENVYIAAFLHDIGATETACDIRTGQSIFMDHSQMGKELMSLMPFSPLAADYVLWHHTSWNELGEKCQGEAPLGAQIIQLADRLERRFDRNRFYYDQLPDHQDWVLQHRGECFAPEIVDAFLELMVQEKFWLDFTSTGIDLILKEMQPNLNARLTRTEVEQIANVFAALIDSTSTYTYNHSRGVAEIMERLAPMFLETEEEVFQMRIAALLHDLGKLAVPKSVLDKPGRLTEREFQLVKSHPYYTKVILGRVKGFEQIKEWAGNHHETVDGRGYPEHKTDLTVPERLMAVADVYQALTEERPYRPPMTTKEAMQVMKGMVREQKLCVAGVTLIQKVV